MANELVYFNDSDEERDYYYFTLFKEATQAKVGSRVRRAIKDFREELEQEKKELKNELFEPDE